MSETLQLAGKLASRSLLTSSAIGQINNLFYVWDKNTCQRFLVDTGAEISVYPASAFQCRNCTRGRELQAANGTRIQTYGNKQLQLDLTIGRFSWKFTLAQVSRPLLGADFLRAHSLIVDLKHNCLLNAKLFSSIPLHAAKQSALQLNNIALNPDVYKKLLSKFPVITAPTLPSTPAKHNVKHHIVTTGPPVHSRARRLSPEKLAIAKLEFEKMLNMGIIRRSASPWASPLHMVPKDGTGWRPCGDYRRLNAITEPDRYTLPHIQDVSAGLAGAKVFSKIDLVKGYHQVPVAQADIPKTAVITPFGLFEFLRMPFGMKNSAQVFQRLMDSVCQTLSFAFVYLDDILVASQSKKQHLLHLEKLFQQLSENGLVVNLNKCSFGKTHIEFLGHHIDANGAKPLTSNVAAIRRFQRPQTIKGLQQFTGMLNFYHRFIPSAASIMLPIYKALSNKPKQLVWTKELQSSFDEAKAALAKAVTLVHPQPQAPVSLTTDASDNAVGGVLEQRVNGSWQPLAFFSRQLRQAEKKYSTFDRELLALHLAIRHFRYFLEGRAFTAYTDHKPLTFAFKKIAEPWSARQQRHLTNISEYTTDVQHIKGKDNVVADALSRSYMAAVRQQTIDLDYHQLAEAQHCDEVEAYRTAVTSLKLEDIHIGTSQTTVLCDTSTGSPRPIVPSSWKRKVFDAVHGLCHPSVRTTQKIMTDKFAWHGINKEVRLWAQQCIECQRSKIHRHVKAPLEYFAVPNIRFSHIHVDIVGPLPESRGAKYLFTIVDRYTRWPEAIPMNEATTVSCARAISFHWIARFGVPSLITSDRGPQFTSNLWREVCQMLGTKHQCTTAFHPQANGLVERFHRHLKTALVARLTDANWCDELPWVLLGIRTLPKEDLKTSSAELVYGSTIPIPGDFIPPTHQEPPPIEYVRTLRKALSRLLPVPTSRHCNIKHSVPQLLLRSEFVFVRKDAYRPPLNPPYDGPFKVQERHEKYFVLDVGGKQQTVSIDRLKPAVIDVSQPLPTPNIKKRGRPRKI